MAVQNSLAPKAQGRTFSEFLGMETVKKQLLNALQDTREVQKFTSSILSAVSTNTKLQDCDQASIISSALLANALQLSTSPQLGFCYMVPFKDAANKRIVATFVLGYKGYIQLAVRSGYYKKLNVLAIKEGELIHFDPLTEEIEVRLIEDEVERELAQTVGYYAMFEYVSGFRKAMYWSLAKMQIHADKHSKAFSLEAAHKLQEGKVPHDELWKYSSFWYKDFDGMAYKTMIRQLISKWGVMSIEMQRAYEADTDVVKADAEEPRKQQSTTLPQAPQDLSFAIDGQEDTESTDIAEQALFGSK